MSLHRIAPVDDFVEGQMRACTVAGVRIVVCRSHGRFHAFADNCPHRNAPLAQGNFVDGCIVCPWHGWEFNVERGALDYNPDIALCRYAVHVDDGALWIELESPSAN